MNSKRFTLVLILLLFVSVNVFAQVQGGTFFIDKSTKGFNLGANEGKRETIVEINFQNPFAEKPTVLASLSLIDLQGEKFEVEADSKVNQTLETRGLKIAVDVTGISRDGFVLKVVVWGNTKVNAAGGSWIAFK
ncbi:MAG: H-type lectin domain-containing protein [Bacteroidota bacterium]|jgi:hypothetical protein